MSDLISIIVPIYNVEEYLRRCLESLVHQTYPNIEVILVNDGSTDNCKYICEEYAKKYSFVRYYEKKNGGLSDARNYGLKKASGELIGFVDSDDWIIRDMFQSLADNMIKYNADIATCDYEMVTDSNRINKLVASKEIEVFNREDAIRHLFDNDKYANYAWNKLYKRSLFDGICFPVGKRMEDLGTTYKLFLKSETVTYNPSQYYKYFQRKSSILHSVKSGLYEDRLELSLERYNTLREKYPHMKENIVFFLNATHDCLPYIEKETVLFSDVVAEATSIDHSYYRHLSIIRRIKSLILKTSPTVYKGLFRKKYDN